MSEIAATTFSYSLTIAVGREDGSARDRIVKPIVGSVETAAVDERQVVREVLGDVLEKLGERAG